MFKFIKGFLKKREDKKWSTKLTYKKFASNIPEMAKHEDAPTLLEMLTTSEGLETAIKEIGIEKTAELIDYAQTSLTSILNTIADQQYEFATNLKGWFDNQPKPHEIKKELRLIGLKLKNTAGAKHGELQKKKTELEDDLSKIELKMQIQQKRWQGAMQRISGLCSYYWDKDGKEFDVKNQ